MPLVPAKCTNCGAVLKVDDTKEQCFCEYCRTTFFVEKAINNYTINNEININNSEVHIHSGLSTDDKVNNAMNLLEVHKDYVKAEELFRTVTKESPDNYLSWLGVFRSKTKDCSVIDCTDPELQVLLDSAIKVVDQDNKSDVQAACDEYKKICSLYEEEVILKQERERKKKNKDRFFVLMVALALFIAVYTCATVSVRDIQELGVGMIYVAIFVILAIILKVSQINKTKAFNQRNVEMDEEIKTIGRKMVKLMSPTKE